jgi:SOS-response transcriptional repressor LexA
MGDPRYPLSLLLRIITVSLETMKIVNSLPELDILETDTELDEAPENAVVLPFRIVAPKKKDEYKTCVPLIPLRTAAGDFSEGQEDLPELDDPEVVWIAWDDHPRFAKNMFVAQVIGKSMEPEIPDGSYCLFRKVDMPSSPDRAVLVRHGGLTDPETGGQFSLKRYIEDEGLLGRKQVVFVPLNPEYSVIEIAEGDEVRVIAEVVKVL